MTCWYQLGLASCWYTEMDVHIKCQSNIAHLLCKTSSRRTSFAEPESHWRSIQCQSNITSRLSGRWNHAGWTQRSGVLHFVILGSRFWILAWIRPELTIHSKAYASNCQLVVSRDDPWGRSLVPCCLPDANLHLQFGVGSRRQTDDDNKQNHDSEIYI
jgi:hypothetical protein